jgi:hypothetical protein
MSFKQLVSDLSKYVTNIDFNEKLVFSIITCSVPRDTIATSFVGENNH